MIQNDKKQKCPQCKGSGKYPDGIKECEACHGTGRVSRAPMSDFRKAFLRSAIPLFVLSVASMAGVAFGKGDEGLEFFFGLLWIGSFLYFIGVIIAVIVYAVSGKRQTMAGTLAGLGIGIVSLGATCFAMMSIGTYI